MNRNKIIIQKIAAIILILLGLLAMLVAWELLLVSNIHNSTVLVLEMGGVLVCMAGYLLRRRIKGTGRGCQDTRAGEPLPESRVRLPVERFSARALLQAYNFDG